MNLRKTTAANLAENSFKTFVESNEWALVDFWASWCPPCKVMEPILNELAAEVGNHVAIGKLNVDEAPTLANAFSIRSIPTIILFRHGDVIAQIIGACSKNHLKDWLDSNLKK